MGHPDSQLQPYKAEPHPSMPDERARAFFSLKAAVCTCIHTHMLGWLCTDCWQCWAVTLVARVRGAALCSVAVEQSSSRSLQLEILCPTHPSSIGSHHSGGCFSLLGQMKMNQFVSVPSGGKSCWDLAMLILFFEGNYLHFVYLIFYKTNGT